MIDGIDCPFCHGTGRHQGKFSGPGWPDCGWCNGTGKDQATISVGPEGLNLKIKNGEINMNDDDQAETSNE